MNPAEDVPSREDSGPFFIVARSLADPVQRARQIAQAGARERLLFDLGRLDAMRQAAALSGDQAEIARLVQLIRPVEIDLGLAR